MYEVKINVEKLGTQQIALTNATSVMNAIEIIKETSPDCEVIAAYLSQYREAYPYDVQEDEVLGLKWYDVTLSENVDDRKTVKSHMLVQACSFDECYARMEGIIKQGYEMIIKSIKESSVDIVTDMTTLAMEGGER